MNPPFYGVEGEGWFLGFHGFTKYVKVTFHRGALLRPFPPGESRHKGYAFSTSTRASSTKLSSPLG